MEKTEIDTRPNTPLPDAEDLDIRAEEATFAAHEEKMVTLWQRRFTQAENFRRPYIERNLRMYKLYRAYREALNYAYGTSLMPPIGFEIIETIKPRLAAAEIDVSIYPTKSADLGNEVIKKWDDLVEFNLQEMEFDDKKIDWIDSCLKFANGTLQIMWNGTLPDVEVVDNFLFYPDPQAGKRLKNSRWEIKQSFKSKAQIEKEEKERGDNPLYILNIDNGEGEQTSLITSDKWKKIEDEQPKADDPRRQRYHINTLKMGQIDKNKTSGQTVNDGESATNDKNEGERMMEIWECFDNIEGKLQVIFNRKHLVRDEDNPYAKINKGRVFIDLPNISLPHEYHAMATLEPVETTIHEIADSRNQAMDDIVFSLDPIRKVRKGQGYKDSDFKHSPGAIWYLKKADDIVFERMPEVSRAWVEKDALLRKEVQSSLALSEYTQGMPNSGQEPSSKVELLLMQTNIRFSLMVRQLEIAMTELVNSLIQMNQEFLEEDLAMRIMGEDFRFEEFKAADKQVTVDARVKIKPKREKTPAQESDEVLEMYDLFVVQDKPEPTATPEEIAIHKKKKNTLQKLIVEKMGYEKYIDILAPDMKKEEETPEPAKVEPAPAAAPRPPVPPGPGGGMVQAPMPEDFRADLPQPADILPLEQTAVPGASTSLTMPGTGAGMGGFLGRLLKGRK